jgi:hypothetical protein
MPEGEGPCTTWPLALGCNQFPEDPEEWDDLVVWSIEVATELLWRFTAGRFGLCLETIRPCRRRCGPVQGGGAGWAPDLIDGRWVNVTCGCPRVDLCSCEGVSEVRLPGPVYADIDHPIQVTVDGDDLPAAAFTLYEPNRLVRVDGQKWPDCQKLGEKLTEPGTWGITYYRGLPVPVGGQMAVTVYAYELWKSCANASECKLPERVQTISRQGVTYTLIDPRDFLAEGLTGITMVDQWIAAVNPGKVRTPSSVHSPDSPRYRQARL